MHEMTRSTCMANCSVIPLNRPHKDSENFNFTFAIQGFTDMNRPISGISVHIANDSRTHLIKVKVAARVVAIYTTNSHATYS